MRAFSSLFALALASTLPLAADVGALSDQLAAAQRAVEQGRYADAGNLFSAVLASTRSQDAPLLLHARAVDGLGDVRRLEGRNDDAAALYERSAELWEQLLGPDQPRLATTVHNLGAVRLAQGDPALAAPLFRRALAIWEKSLGPESPQAQASRRALQVCSP